MTRAHTIAAAFLMVTTLARSTQARPSTPAQPSAQAQDAIDVTGRITNPQSAQTAGGHPHLNPAAAVWLTAIHPETASASPQTRNYTMLQKNKMFSPHLLIVPVGSVVHFPNADPFFHNVFSLFNGRRFDLGLYEAGSTKDVVFSREGVSYIFCNIHSEMSAVVIVVNTTYYTAVDLQGRVRLKSVPPDTYMMHVWIEGESQETLDTMTRKVQIAAGHSDLGSINLPEASRPHTTHDNKFGQPYDHPEALAY